MKKGRKSSVTIGSGCYQHYHVVAMVIPHHHPTGLHRKQDQLVRAAKCPKPPSILYCKRFCVEQQEANAWPTSTSHPLHTARGTAWIVRNLVAAWPVCPAGYDHRRWVYFDRRRAVKITTSCDPCTVQCPPPSGPPTLFLEYWRKSSKLHLHYSILVACKAVKLSRKNKTLWKLHIF